MPIDNLDRICGSPLGPPTLAPPLQVKFGGGMSLSTCTALRGWRIRRGIRGKRAIVPEGKIILNVYLLQAGLRGPIKIGVARNVRRRLKTLQTGNHQELRVLAVIPCGTDGSARNLESQLHRKFSKSRIRGEWFRDDIRLDDVRELAGFEDPRQAESDELELLCSARAAIG